MEHIQEKSSFNLNLSLLACPCRIHKSDHLNVYVCFFRDPLSSADVISACPLIVHNRPSLGRQSRQKKASFEWSAFRQNVCLSVCRHLKSESGANCGQNYCASSLLYMVLQSILAARCTVLSINIRVYMCVSNHIYYDFVPSILPTIDFILWTWEAGFTVTWFCEPRVVSESSNPQVDGGL